MVRGAPDGIPRAAVPSIFLGPAKSGTTFLFDCLSAAFHPSKLCGHSAASWSDAACGARTNFVLGVQFRQSLPENPPRILVNVRVTPNAFTYADAAALYRTVHPPLDEFDLTCFYTHSQHRQGGGRGP